MKTRTEMPTRTGLEFPTGNKNRVKTLQKSNSSCQRMPLHHLN